MNEQTKKRGAKLWLRCLVLVACLSTLSVALSAQTVSINFKKEKLSVVLKEIQKQIPYNFLYNNSLIDANELVSINVKNEKIENIMGILLKDTKIAYKIVDKQITLYPKEYNQPSQPKKGNVPYKGKISDSSTGEPLVGVTIRVSGTDTYTVTDIDGSFSIVASNGSILEIKSLGMKAKEVKCGEKTDLIVTLESDTMLIDELVVTGITQTDKRLFTGATDKLTAVDVKIDGIPEIGRALDGRSAGVSVQNVSGTFGTAPKIRVRGATSILGSSKPLWVVDGVALEDVRNFFGCTFVWRCNNFN